MAEQPITQHDVWQAKQRIAPIVSDSPLIYSEKLSEYTDTSIYLKLENLNPSQSFKIRGAANKILSLTPEKREQGVTAFSTGNFGMSVAYIARQLGIKSVICISERVPKAKVNALKRSGAQIEIYGQSQDDAEQRAYQLEQEQGLSVVHPFDDPDIIAGHGTIGLELLNDLPSLDTVIGGLSGGGLHSGLGISLKSADSAIQVAGVSTIRAPAMYESIRQGRPVAIEEQDTLADSLLGGIGLNNRYTFDMVRQYVDDILLLDDDQIAQGMAFMLAQHGLMVEGAAASGIGAILNNRIDLGSLAVAVITGCAVDTGAIIDVIEKYPEAIPE